MHSRVLFALASIGLLLASCPFAPPPSGEQLLPATGVVRLPTSYPTSMAALKVMSTYGAGEATVDENGRFTLLVPPTGSLQVDLVDAQGKILMMGHLSAGGGEISPRQSAIILAFYALGGFTLPPENHEALMALIADHAALVPLTQVVENCLITSPAVISDGDNRLTDAIRAARDAMLGSAAARALGGDAAGRSPLNKDSSLMTIQPTARQSGIEILQNEGGNGVLAQNSFRRYATFLVYRTGTEAEDGTTVMLNPPVAVGAAHDISSTSRLEFFSAIGDAFTGHAPFEPVRTNPVELPIEAGSTRTFYDVVVLGPAIESVYPPIFQDIKYFGFADEWNNRLDQLRFKMFWLDFAWPAIETFLFVKGANAQQAKLDQFVTEFKSLCDRRLLALGVILRSKDPKEGGLVVAMNLLLNALKEDTFRLEFVDACKRALNQSALNQASFESMAAKLKGRASASAIVAAIQIAMTVGDLGAVMKDALNSRTGELWAVTVLSPRVRLDPHTATVTLNQPAATLTATVRGTNSTSFVYRWSTPGGFGTLTDLHGKQGTSFDSAHGSVNYLANVGAIKNGDMETVTVRVFENSGGAAGAFIGQATATIRGQRDDGQGGPVTLEAYPNNQPEINEGRSITAHLDAGGVQAGQYRHKWTTSGNHGKFNGNRTLIEGTDEWDVWYYPNADALDQQTDWVKVEIFRVSDGELIGSAQIIMDIWNPRTIYALCGDAAGQLGPYLGSGTAWWFYVVGHGPWMGAAFYARPGDKIHASLSCTHGACAYNLGPVYVRRGNLGDPPDTTVLIASEGRYACTPEPGSTNCPLVNMDITLP